MFFSIYRGQNHKQDKIGIEITPSSMRLPTGKSINPLNTPINQYRTDNTQKQSSCTPSSSIRSNYVSRFDDKNMHMPTTPSSFNRHNRNSQGLVQKNFSRYDK